MTTLSSEEYRELKDFLSFYSVHYMPIDNLPREKRPIACLEVLEKKSLKTAAQGLRQAINDIIAMSRRMDYVRVQKIDSDLRSRGLVTLSELRRRYSSDYARIISKKIIKNETDYYLARGIIDDLGAPISKEDRDVLVDLIRDFEQRQTGGGQRGSR